MKRALFLILTILIAIEIFFFSSLTGDTDTGTQGFPLAATAYHLIVFFLLAFFLFATFNTGKRTRADYLILTLVISITYALLDEFHQMLVPLRDASIRDIIIDSTGIFLGVLTYAIINKTNRREEHHPLFSEEEYENEHVQQLAPHP